MKHHVALGITSLLLSLLLLIHVADDIARGLDTAKPAVLIALLVVGVWMYAAMILAGRRSGQILLILQAVLGVGVCFIHLEGRHINEIARTNGGIFFMSTLFTIGAASFVAFILGVQGLVSGLRRTGAGRNAST